MQSEVVGEFHSASDRRPEGAIRVRWTDNGGVHVHTLHNDGRAHTGKSQRHTLLPYIKQSRLSRGEYVAVVNSIVEHANPDELRVGERNGAMRVAWRRRVRASNGEWADVRGKVPLEACDAGEVLERLLRRVASDQAAQTDRLEALNQVVDAQRRTAHEATRRCDEALARRRQREHRVLRRLQLVLSTKKQRLVALRDEVAASTAEVQAAVLRLAELRENMPAHNPGGHPGMGGDGDGDGEGEGDSGSERKSGNESDEGSDSSGGPALPPSRQQSSRSAGRGEGEGEGEGEQGDEDDEGHDNDRREGRAKAVRSPPMKATERKRGLGGGALSFDDLDTVPLAKPLKRRRRE